MGLLKSRAFDSGSEGLYFAGSNIILTFSMGGNAIKLKEYGLEEETRSLNKRLAEISKEAAGGKALVAGDISSCGSLLAPYGEISFEESVESYKKQIQGLLDGVWTFLP
jgi:5-methyltetrahydrofolate--homocysteine methyltransferase